MINNEIIIYFNELSNSSALRYDGMNPIVIKKNAVFLSNQLCYIFNLSFEKGLYPSRLKNAIVASIFKSGSRNDPKNYWPISVLSIFAKLLERIFFKRLSSFAEKNLLLHYNQFGFWSNISTNLAIANVVLSLINKINVKKHTAFMLFDLKKAFDLVNHKLLINKLSHYGIRGLPLQWMISYLSGLSQKWKINNLLSSQQVVSSGVPQGSCLSSLLFILFINDIFHLEGQDIEIYLYADDTAAIFPADSDDKLQFLISQFLAKYQKWYLELL